MLKTQEGLVQGNLRRVLGAALLVGISTGQNLQAGETTPKLSNEMKISMQALLDVAGWNCRSIYPEEPHEPEYSHMRATCSEAVNSVILRTTTFHTEDGNRVRTTMTVTASIVIDDIWGKLTVGANTSRSTDIENNTSGREEEEQLEMLFEVAPSTSPSGGYLIRGFTTIDDETAQLICTPATAQ